MNANTVELSPLSRTAVAMKLATRATFKPVFNPRLPLLVQRSVIGSVSRVLPRPRGLRNVETFLNGVLARRLIPEGAPVGKAVLYLHGGGYVLGSPATHFGMAGRLALASGCEVFVIDYRLAPEHPAPAALEDALSAWSALCRTHAAVALAGDSAGGGLSLALAVAARDAGLPPPKALALISPWVDLSLSGDSMQPGAVDDPLLSRAWLTWAAAQYAGSCALDDPRLSPLFASLAGLPPTLIHTGSDEVLLSDTHRLAAALGKSGVPVDVSIYEGLWHDFQLQGGVMPEADESLHSLGSFLRDAMDAAA
jgi:epsilon-lactone hydrolase